jgi:regulator of sigma E protease
VAQEPPSPAWQAGIRAGDRFVALDGRPVRSWAEVLDRVKGTMSGEGETATARALQVDVLREGRVLSLRLTPSVIRDTDPIGQYYYRPIIGVVRLGGYTDGETTRVYYPFPQAVSRASTETVQLGGLILGHLGKLVTGEAAVRKSLGGPVEMFRQARSAAERGLFDWARLMGMLSISLGIVNLLPVPVLDGGQILFYAVEGVRGRPLSLALRERVQQVGLLFLVLLMLSVLVFDIQRIFEGPG